LLTKISNKTFLFDICATFFIALSASLSVLYCVFPVAAPHHKKCCQRLMNKRRQLSKAEHQKQRQPKLPLWDDVLEVAPLARLARRTRFASRVAGGCYLPCT
jgi:hypothetical protein